MNDKVISKKGYDISKIISNIGKMNFKKACLSCSGGCTDYQDEEKGEVSYLYQFRSNKLVLNIYIEIDCKCDPSSENYDEFYCEYCDKNNETKEEVILNEKQYLSFFINNLFR